MENSIAINGKTIKLGQVVVDKSTGLKGPIVGVTLWGSGRVQYCVQPKELKKGFWLDQDKVTEVNEVGTVKPEPAFPEL